jgi:hypothetical protein
MNDTAEIIYAQSFDLFNTVDSEEELREIYKQLEAETEPAKGLLRKLLSFFWPV